MKIQEVLKMQQENPENILIVKEGLFWRCYEKSAWLFAANIKDCRAIKKNNKTVNREIVCISFLDSVLGTVIGIIKEKGFLFTTADKFVSVEGFPAKEGFEKWKAEIPLTPPYKKRKKTIDPVEGIIAKIHKYPFVNNTLAEVFEFMANIQNEINGYVLTGMKATGKQMPQESAQQ